MSAVARSFALAWCCACTLLAGCGSPSERPPRIVLITLDTLRWDRFDGERTAMPALAARTRGGLVFENAYSATSTTQPTHASLFTGLHPWQHGVTRNGVVLAPEHETVAERLRAAGYHTAAVVASLPLHSRFRFDQGFDAYEDDFEQGSPDGRTPEWAGDEREPGFYDFGARVATKAIDLIEAAPHGPQFFWFHFFDPHSPYGDSEDPDSNVTTPRLRLAIERRPERVPKLLEKARRLYDVDVRYMDVAIERVLGRLDRDADRYETHLVVTADHGESFGEGGSVGHGRRLIASQTHVPLVIASPTVAAGRRADPAGSVDVTATLLALAGLAPADGAHGRDLRNPPEAGPPPVCGMRRTFAEPVRELRTDGSVAMIHAPRFYCVKDGRLLIGDRDVIEADGDVPTAVDDPGLRAAFAGFEQELRSHDLVEDLDAETQSALEALGYAR